MLHKKDLSASLGEICLVDADGIYPDRPRLSVVAEMKKCLEQSGRHREFTVVDLDSLSQIRRTPNVRKSFVRDILTRS